MVLESAVKNTEQHIRPSEPGLGGRGAFASGEGVGMSGLRRGCRIVGICDPSERVLREEACRQSLISRCFKLRKLS